MWDQSLTVHWGPQIREMHGFDVPVRVRVRVPTGTGTGNDSHTRDLQNEPKNIFFEPELNELWPIS